MRADRAAVAFVEGADWSDGWSERVRSVVEPLIGRGTRRDALTGRWMGHPAHPMIVMVPMTCWIGATAVDLIGGRGAERIARKLVGAGVVAALPAAATGAADWLDTEGAERRIGVAHALANNVATIAFSGSWLARRAGRRPLGGVLSSVGVAALGVSGFLGGHLAYTRGVGVNTTAFQSGPVEWTPLCSINRLEADLVQIKLGAVAFAVVRRVDRFDVVEDRCTHRGAPLSEGRIVHDCIECPWHGSRFATETGAVRAGPASIPQPAYETRVREGILEIRRIEHGGLRRNPVGASAAVTDND